VCLPTPPFVAPFAGGVWKIHVELPDQYPFKSPSIGFMNKIFHPNIDELCVPHHSSGSPNVDLPTVAYLQKWFCLPRRHWPGLVADVWCVLQVVGLLSTRGLTEAGPIDMINIIEVFLPQLLRYPNPNDPLNGEAAALLMRQPKDYEAKVKGEPARSRLGCLSRALLVEYVKRYATKEAADGAGASASQDDDEDEVMSDVGSISDDD